MVGSFRCQYLTDTGWLISAETKESVDKNGPVPWITYPAIRILSTITRPHYRVFEFGAGSSTLWWGKRTAEVVSVDHDGEWVEHLGKQLEITNSVLHVPINAPTDPTLLPAVMPFFDESIEVPRDTDPERNDLLSEPFKSYVSQIAAFPAAYFDVIVIDGMARVFTAWMAARFVNPNGFILFDNSDRVEYEPGYALLRRAGFQIDFWGPGPINPYEWCTSIFAKTIHIFAS
jgi:hypothetical protein